MPHWLKPSLNWLLVFIPVAAFLYYKHDESLSTWVFTTSCLAIIPLAGLMGTATEHLAEKTGEGVGGLLNATFGNAAELIIAMIALQNGQVEIVKASLTGSIIGNVLLVTGAAFFAGGLKYKVQRFSAVAARSQATMMTLAAIALIVPAAYHHLGSPAAEARHARAEHALVSEEPPAATPAPAETPAPAATASTAEQHHEKVEAFHQHERDLSLEIAGVLLLTYGFMLLFSLHTHKSLFAGEAAEAATDSAQHPPWPVWKSLGLLIVATLAVAWISEMLVHSVEGAAKALGMSDLFIGVIVVAIIGNAAEHSTAVLVARKNRMDLALSVAMGSSVQIALFVAPVLVLAGLVMGKPMDLVFTLPEVLAIVVSVIIAEQIAGDGESNWLEGVQLLSVYAILGMVFYHF